MSEVLHIVVEGQVQGVGFRYFTREVAQSLGVAGWVRNLPGGNVEVLARVGPASKGRFLALLQQGPPMSRVKRVRVEPPGPEQDCPASGFSVRH